MRNRRMAAYSIDLLIFMLVTFVTLLGLRGIVNPVLRFLVALVVLTLVYAVVFGLVSTYLRGSIGKKIMDLKVMPTAGMMTPIRLVLRDVVGKYFVSIPLVIGLLGLVPRVGQTRATGLGALPGWTLASVVLWGILTVANAYFYTKEKRWMVDVILHTNVENDIPTATEYQDLRLFLEEENEA